MTAVVVIDVMKYDVAPLFPLPDGSPSAAEPPKARLFRWIFDPSGQSNTYKETQLDDRAGEFPRFDERFCMSDYRHGWIVSGNIVDPRTGEPRTDGITHYDLASGKNETWTANPATASASPCSCRATTRPMKAMAGC